MEKKSHRAAHIKERKKKKISGMFELYLFMEIEVSTRFLRKSRQREEKRGEFEMKITENYKRKGASKICQKQIRKKMHKLCTKNWTCIKNA